MLHILIGGCDQFRTRLDPRNVRGPDTQSRVAPPAIMTREVQDLCVRKNIAIGIDNGLISQGKPLGPGANRACLKKTRMSVEEIVHQSACNESYDLLSSPTQRRRQNPSKCRIHQLADSAFKYRTRK